MAAHDEAVHLGSFCLLGFTMMEAVSGTAARRFSLPLAHQAWRGSCLTMKVGVSQTGMAGYQTDHEQARPCNPSTSAL